MLTNTIYRWGSAAKTFHWLIAILIVLEVPAGYLMAYTFRLSLHDKAVLPLSTFFAQIHQTNGLTILLLVVGRLAWRLFNPKVAPAEEGSPLQRFVSNAVHGALYALLFILPLSGWSALSVLGVAPIWLFNLQGVVPAILPKQPYGSAFGYGFFAKVHIWALYTGGVLLSLHIVAALWHHFGLKDKVLARMWPLGRMQDESIPPV